MNSKWMVAAFLAVALTACGSTDTDPGVGADGSLSGTDQSGVNADEKADAKTATKGGSAGDLAAEPSGPSSSDDDSVDVPDAGANDETSVRPDEEVDPGDAPDEDPTTAACQADECGPGLGAPNVLCDDGTLGGPVCERDADGVCGWIIRECPAKECTFDECGPGPRPPIVECYDGSTGGPLCERDDHGVCGWYIRECPAECDPSKCGDEPDWLAMCDDGTELRPVCVPADDSATAACNWLLPDCR